MSMQAHSRPSPYAPINSNPLRLASATIQAVDQLGVATSNEIEKTADEIMRGASEIADKLRELADAIRQHTEIASGHVETFCTKATSVFESVIELQEKLLVNGRALEAETEGTDGPLSLPEFMKKGPAPPDDTDPGSQGVVGIVNQPRAEGEGQIRDPYTGPGMKCP
jgi:hypothetical protein